MSNVLYSCCPPGWDFSHQFSEDVIFLGSSHQPSLATEAYDRVLVSHQTNFITSSEAVIRDGRYQSYSPRRDDALYVKSNLLHKILLLCWVLAILPTSAPAATDDGALPSPTSLPKHRSSHHQAALILLFVMLTSPFCGQLQALGGLLRVTGDELDLEITRNRHQCRLDLIVVHVVSIRWRIITCYNLVGRQEPQKSCI